MGKVNKIALTENDLRRMVSKATRHILKEYWTSADDAAEAAYNAANKRIEQEFQDILRTDERYVHQVERLKRSFGRFMQAFEEEKEKLAKRFRSNARVQSQSMFYPEDFEIYVRDVDGKVTGGPENIDVVGGHRLSYQGNSYEEGTLSYDPHANLELTVRFTLKVVNHYEKHEVRPAKSWWEDENGNPVNGSAPGARKIPKYNPDWEKDHEGEDDWESPDGKYRHRISGRGYVKTSRDVYNERDKGIDEDYVAAFETLAVRNLAKLGRDSWNRWKISFDDSWYGDGDNYKVTFFI